MLLVIDNVLLIGDSGKNLSKILRADTTGLRCKICILDLLTCSCAQTATVTNLGNPLPDLGGPPPQHN